MFNRSLYEILFCGYCIKPSEGELYLVLTCINTQIVRQYEYDWGL